MKRRSFAIIGLGRFGSAMATTLVELGQEVIGIDTNGERVQALADTLTQTIELDAVDVRALRAAGVDDVDVAVVSIGENIEASLLVVMQLKELGIDEVVAKAVSPLHGRVLQKLGVSRIIYPERDMAIRVAHSIVVPNVIDYIELSRDVSIVELPAPAAFAGKTLRELALRPKYGVTLIAVKRRGRGGAEESTSMVPGADDVIEEGDVLSLLGPNDRLTKLTEGLQG